MQWYPSDKIEVQCLKLWCNVRLLLQCVIGGSYWRGRFSAMFCTILGVWRIDRQIWSFPFTYKTSCDVRHFHFYQLWNVYDVLCFRCQMSLNGAVPPAVYHFCLYFPPLCMTKRLPLLLTTRKLLKDFITSYIQNNVCWSLLRDASVYTDGNFFSSTTYP